LGKGAVVKKSSKPRKKRPNPAFPGKQLAQHIADVAGNLAVTQALQGASLDERLMVSAFMPALLAIIRTATKKTLSDKINEMFPGGVVLEMGGIDAEFISPSGTSGADSAAATKKQTP
jgi:hypothetical protein